nr:GTP-binding protein TypA/BipA homolog [Ipomoea batatas]
MEMAIGSHSFITPATLPLRNPILGTSKSAFLKNRFFGSKLASCLTAKAPFQLCSVNPLRSSIKCSASQATELSTEKTNQLMRRSDIRNIAIVAHVDHGKTTLVDAMLRQAKVFRDNQFVQERIMDSNDLERERGITILSKNTSITYNNTKINIIDTPGHSDFGGEVERILNMVEGVLLVVDSVEGPMPQTRFVLKKALEFGHAVVVVVNKIDRPSARPDYVVNSTFELFIELNASDEQCDFQVIYASGIKGKAGLEPENLANDLGPLFESIIRCIPGPRIEKDGALQMLATNIEYDEHKGRIAIGRVHAGTLKRGMDVRICTSDDVCRFGRVSELFVYEKFNRVPADSVEAGDICAVCGIDDIQIGGDYSQTKVNGKALPTIQLKNPQLEKLRFQSTFRFHWLLLSARRGNGVLVELLGRKARQDVEGNGLFFKYKIRPVVFSRCVMQSDCQLEEQRSQPLFSIAMGTFGWLYISSDQGSMVALRMKQVHSYALSSSQKEGKCLSLLELTFIKPKVSFISAGGLVSERSARKKLATNVRSNKEQTEKFVFSISSFLRYMQWFSIRHWIIVLDDCIEYIQEDELVEVTPQSIRMCKNPKITITKKTK